MKERAMSMMGDPSSDDEENNEDYENYVHKKEDIKQKKLDKAENPKKTIRQKLKDKKDAIKARRAKNIAAIQARIDEYKEVKNMSPEDREAYKLQKKQLQE